MTIFQRPLPPRLRDLARSGRTDPRASSHAAASIETTASPDAVWRVLSGIGDWPQTLPGISRVEIASPPLTAGTGFTWRNKGVALTSTIERLAPLEELTWTGTAGWLHAIHRNTITPLPGRGCRLTSEESMSGLLAGQLMASDRLQGQLEEWVDTIARAAQTTGQ